MKFVCLVGWLAGWLVGWLFGYLVAGLVGWLVACSLFVSVRFIFAVCFCSTLFFVAFWLD